MSGWQILGALMLLFLVTFGLWKQIELMGWRETFGIWGGGVAATGFIFVAVSLLAGELP